MSQFVKIDLNFCTSGILLLPISLKCFVMYKIIDGAVAIAEQHLDLFGGTVQEFLNFGAKFKWNSKEF